MACACEDADPVTGIVGNHVARVGGRAANHSVGCRALDLDAIT